MTAMVVTASQTIFLVKFMAALCTALGGLAGLVKLSLRWLDQRLDAHLEPIRHELQPNGGGSMRDEVRKITGNCALMSADIAAMKADITSVKVDINSVKAADVEQRVELGRVQATLDTYRSMGVIPAGPDEVDNPAAHRRRKPAA